MFTPHFHSWLPDGVFHLTAQGTLGFHRLAPPQDRDIEALVTRIAQRIERYLDVADEADVDEEQATLSHAADSPLLPSLSVVVPPKPLCASLDGYSLHADLAVRATERRKLERFLRYGLRHPFAQRRLSLRPDGTVLLKLRKPTARGQRHLALAPLDFLRRLAATIPPPRLNMVRFHGVFAPRASVRPLLAALRPAPAPAPSSSGGPSPTADEEDVTQDRSSIPPRYRRTWAELLKRVFDLDDILLCPRCGSSMRNISHIEQPETIAHILGHLGLPTSPPAVAPARAPPQLGLDLDDLETAFGDWD